MAVVEFESLVVAVEESSGSSRDFRMLPVGVGLWAAEAAVLSTWGMPGGFQSWVPGAVAVLGIAAVIAGVVRRRRSSAWLVVTLVGFALLVGTGLAALRADPLHAAPVAEMASRGAYVTVEFTVTSAPALRDVVTTVGGPAAAQRWSAEATMSRVAEAGRAWNVRLPITVGALVPQPADTSAGAARPIASVGSAAVPPPTPGMVLRGTGAFRAPWPGHRQAAILSLRGPPVLVSPPDRWHRLPQRLRDAMAVATAGLSEDSRGLLPGLVVGDESRMPADLVADMRRVGMSHLTAVSGSNLAIVTGSVLLLARGVRLPRRLAVIIAAAALFGFVAVVGPQPSVLRAAAMGTIMLAALLTGRSRTPAAVLAVSVVALLLVDPWLSVSIGFALSVAATVGLIAYSRWARGQPDMTRGRRLWRDVVGITLAAQLATAPLVAAIGGGLPIIGIPANLLAAPAIAPATIIGCVTALLAPIAPGAAAQLASIAGVATEWVAMVARTCAGFSWGVLPWPSGPIGALLLIGPGLVVWWWWRRRRPSRSSLALSLAAVLALVVATRTNVSGGWPPTHWAAVFCDVGQGDATVIATAPRHGIVVDAGPQPQAVDRCLDKLDISAIDLLVLTHFHADHVEGLPGLLHGRTVARVLVSPLAAPAGEVRRVESWLSARGLSPEVAAPGEQAAVGSVRYQVLWPRRILRGQGSEPNNASVTLVVAAGALRLLLAGDVEPAAQEAMISFGSPGPVDVVKIPHHGSRNQSPRLIGWSGARLAVASAGVGNTYGHPSQLTLDAWRNAGAIVGRTDTEGDVAVLRLPDGRAGMVTRRRQG